MKGVSESWLTEKGLVLQEDGTYRRPTPMLDKALKQSPTPLFKTLGETISTEAYLSIQKDAKSLKTLDTTSINKKVKNATKHEVDGIKFDSRLEAHLYGQLRANGIRFEMQVPFVLQEKFRYGTEAIRDIKVIMDFVLTDYPIILDSKGWQLSDGKIKYKMLKKYFYDKGQFIEIVMPSNHKEVAEFLNKLIKKV